MQNASKGHSRNKGRALASSGKRMLDHNNTQNIGPGSLTMENPLNNIPSSNVKDRSGSQN